MAYVIYDNVTKRFVGYNYQNFDLQEAKVYTTLKGVKSKKRHIHFRYNEKTHRMDSLDNKKDLEIYEVEIKIKGKVI